MESNSIWIKHLETAKKIAERSRIKVVIEHYFDEGLDVDNWVTIRLEDREQVKKTIVKTTRTMEPRFIVEVAHVTSNYPHEPDDVDITEVDDFRSIEEAVKCAMMLIVENEINHAIENTSMEAYLADEKEREGVV